MATAKIDPVQVKDDESVANTVDTVLDGTTVYKDSAKVIRRLASASEHLYTGNEREIKYLTNNFTGQGGWTLDETSLRAGPAHHADQGRAPVHPGPRPAPVHLRLERGQQADRVLRLAEGLRQVQLLRTVTD